MSEERESKKLAAVSQNVEQTLNLQGFSFQNAVMRRAARLNNKGTSLWTLEASEFPVALGSQNTHIDFIYKLCRNFNDEYRLFMIGECKRVNPAFGYWAFAKSSYSFPNKTDNLTQFDQIRCFSSLPQFNARTKIAHTRERSVMDLGFAFKTGKTGNSGGSNDQNAINEAVSQVLKASSGFIDYLCDETKESKLDEDKNNIFIPAIFTTAKLFVTDADLGTADIQTGNLAQNSVKAKEVKWLWFNHNRSRNLSHHVRFHFSENSIENRFFEEVTRTVAIINSDGVEDFLNFKIENWLF